MKIALPVSSPSISHRHIVLASAACAAASLGVAAGAAEVDPGSVDSLEQVVVTGTRIVSANMTSTSPIVAVSAEEIRNSGRLDITDMLNQLPQVNSDSLGQDLGNRTSGLTSAGGVATANLRGLGPNRTLVLLDGRRLGVGSPQTVISAPAPDVDQIPSALVERVDVVTGGASAVYGSDAIAGVINFIMKKNFEGVQLDAQLGGNWHDNNNGFAQQHVTDGGYTPPRGTIWDGRTTNLSITAGQNFLEGRGNVTGYYSYSSMRPVRSDARDFGACQLDLNETLDDLECSGSSNSNFFSPANTTLNPDGDVFSVLGSSFVEWGEDTTPPQIFNTQEFIYMQRQDKRHHAGAMAHLDVSDHFRLYGEAAFMKDNTHQEVAPTALFRQSNPLTDDGNYLINCSNPLLSVQQASLICTPGEIAADTLNPGSVSGNVEIGRRNVEGGARNYDFEHKNYRATLGTKGILAPGWTYDTYAQYYKVKFFNANSNDFSYDKIADALQVTGTAAAPVCISGSPCVPYNMFSDGGVTEEALGFLTSVGTSTGSTTLQTFHADATGHLGEYGLQLPGADDDVAVNVGFEYRKEKVRYTPDDATLGGLIVGLGGAYPSIDKSSTVKELFGEIRVPIMQGKPGVHELLADAGYRYSDYSTAGGTNTYKFEVQYAPVRDLRFRASYNRAIRAPSIVELFTPQLVGKIQFGEDPCAPGESTGVATATLEECMRTGVTALQYGNGGSTNTIPQGTGGQLTQLQGGNPDLSPESANTYSFGLTIRPEALPGFSGSIDYYHITLKDTVDALPASLIMENCLNSGDPTFCSQLVRHPITGTLNGASVSSGGYIVQTNVNIGAGELDGIDLQMAYGMGLANMGSLKFSLNGAYLLSNKSTPIPGGGTYDCAGLFGPTCQTVNSRWRHSLRTAWSITEAVTVMATWRYSSGVSLDHNDPDPDLFLSISDFDDVLTYRSNMPAVSYIDLGSTWEIGERIQLRAGINNVFDKDPPIAPSQIVSGGSPNYYEFYDGLGRQLFVAVSARF